MSSVEQAFAKDFPEDSKTMNDVTAPILMRARAESTFNVYKKGWEAAMRKEPVGMRGYYNEVGHRGGQRVRKLIEEGKRMEEEGEA